MYSIVLLTEGELVQNYDYVDADEGYSCEGAYSVHKVDETCLHTNILLAVNIVPKACV